MDVICTGGVAATHDTNWAGNGKTSISLRLSLLLSLLCAGLPAEAAGLGKRVENTTLRMPPHVSGFQYTTENAFGDLSFTHPMTVVSPPGERSRVFVVEQGGTIILIPNLNQPTKVEFLDISGKVSYGRPEDEGGILGLAFHPNYAANGHFFVYYLCNTATADGVGRHNRLSRFTRSRNDPNKADPGSEVILFSQYDEKFNHNGGTILFGPDGYLYLSLGDEGHPDDMFDNAQRIDKDFFSAVIRIDVDERPGSLEPNPHRALGGRVNYRIPPDNPYVGATSFNGQPVDPDRVRTEFYAVGIRSPWRMFWDVPTDTLYLSDVGENAGEEINVIVKGGNYGWPYRLANEDGPKVEQAPEGFSSIPPLLTYERGESGPDVGRAAIGGVVYRGSAFPELNGAYIFGDYYSGNIWKLRNSGNSLQEWTHLTTLPQLHLVSFGTDPSNGDVLICDVGDGKVRRLVKPAADDVIPQTLADTGAFQDLQTLEPHPGIVPYDVNVSFWSDGAWKRRWFSIPDPAAKIHSAGKGRWEFPEGSVFIKHFELELVKGDPASRRRVETRFLVRNSEGVYGLTYRWNDAQDNAFLVGSHGDNQTFTVVENGVTRQQVWRFPSRSECITCHNPVGGLVLGVNGAQLNRTFNYGGGNVSQIRALAQAGYFAGQPSVGRKLVDPANQRASLEARTRSYVEVNCAYCHQPGGLARSSWDARVSVPKTRNGIINGTLNDPMGDPANRVVAPRSPEHSMLLQRMTMTDPARRMPPLGSSVVDEDAVALISEWINKLPKRRAPLNVRIISPRGASASQQLVTLSGTARGEELARIVYSVNGGPEQTAAGGTAWSTEVTLAPGKNRIMVFAEDQAGRRSRPARKIVRLAPQ